jgi:N-acetylmuramoyl-L-alanine amidase
MESFRSAIKGRGDDQPGLLEATSALNLRSGPGLDFGKAQAKALVKGTRMQLISAQDQWIQVTVLGKKGTGQATGWVHGQYVKQV